MPIQVTVIAISLYIFPSLCPVSGVSEDCVCFVSREQALLTARRSPVLGRHREYERIHYPHVYDAYAEATKTSAFIGGSKVSCGFNKYIIFKN